MVIFKAKAAKTIEEAFADNVTGGVFAPPLRVAARDDVSFSPAKGLCFGVEASGSRLFFLRISTPRRWWRVAHLSSTAARCYWLLTKREIWQNGTFFIIILIKGTHPKFLANIAPFSLKSLKYPKEV